MIYRAVVVFAMLCATPASAADPTARPTLSRADLPRLKTLDRTAAFAALGSFDDRGLSDAEFTSRALDLLDAQRIPGLAAARQTGDPDRALDAVFHACRGDRAAPGKAAADAAKLAAANEVLEHRFSFYGEQHQLPPGIDWDANPGTAHWGHDLNRFTFLSPLTQAYLATGDTRYSRKGIELILDWIAKSDASRCFAGSRYVWGSYLNNAIHCQAWCSCLATLVACDQVTPIELLRVLKSVHDQRGTCAARQPIRRFASMARTSTAPAGETRGSRSNCWT